MGNFLFRVGDKHSQCSCIVLYGMAAKPLLVEGVPVQFPLKPYRSQLMLMMRVIKSCKLEQHALLESPTGTGKSLALLCATLAWQQIQRQQEHVDIAIDNSESGSSAAYTPSAIPPESHHTPTPADCTAATGPPATAPIVEEIQNADSDDDFKPSVLFRKPPPPPAPSPEEPTGAVESTSKRAKISPKKTTPVKIFYATRTHRQIEQVVNELRKTAYASVRMTVLSSREQSCIRHFAPGLSKNDECLKMMDETKGGGGCRMYKNIQSLSSSPLFSIGAWDIEELLAAGRKKNACPYYAARELLADADIVFCPYNYLLDPGIRKQMSISMKGHIVILDEAHNIEDITREIASITITVDKLQELAEQVGWVGAAKGSTQLVSVLRGLCSWLERSTAVAALRAVDYESYSLTLSGPDAARALETCGVTKITIGLINEHLRSFLEDLVKLKSPGIDVGTLERLVSVLTFFVGDDGLRIPDFAVLLRRAMVKDGGIKSCVRSLTLSCLNSAVASTALRDARSVILASGTLSPLQSFASELGIRFDHTLEADHVIKPNQLWATSWAFGPTGRSITCNYQNLAGYDLQDDIGAVLLRVCTVVPFGVLAFFPSYGLLDRLVDRWKATGVWAALENFKCVVVEPRGNKSKDELQDCLQEFYSAIRSAENPGSKDKPMDSNKSGGLMLAVARGKISEGLNFSDNNCRAVINVGIPYAPFKDELVRVKQGYNDAHHRDRGLLDGRQWYDASAFRALNQGLGRCIRHREDWSAVILLDDRFNREGKYSSALPVWVRKHLQRFSSHIETEDSLLSFIAERTAIDAALPVVDDSGIAAMPIVVSAEVAATCPE